MAEENKIQIGEVARGNIIISVSSFNGQKYLDIRKYYEEEGEWKPTKKGIALNKEQYEAVLDILIREKDRILKEMA